jgi:hypothetical protein
LLPVLNVENVNIFHTIFSKMFFFVHFSFVFGNFFHWKIKMAGKFIMKDDIFQKDSRFYYSTTAEWNVLFFWFVVVLMIYKNKNIVAMLRKSKWRLNPRWRRFFFIFHIIINFVAWQHWFYFIIALELHHIKKLEHFIQRFRYQKIMNFCAKNLAYWIFRPFWILYNKIYF